MNYGIMCLITTNERRIADKDITVHKVAVLNGNYAVTPVFQKNIETNVRTIDDAVECVTFDGTFYEVNGGYFHSYENPEDARRDWAHQLKKYPKYKVFRCVIPKGVEYYYSEVSCQYASKEIIIYNQ